MITREEIDALAELSKLDLSDDEKEKLRREIDSIVSYISEIKEVAADLPEHAPTGLLKNVFREDIPVHETGEHTATLIDAAPAQKDNYVIVKKILG